MRLASLLILLVTIGGCVRSTSLDRAAFDLKYQETALAEGTLSSLPISIAPDQPAPIVINWFYAGSRGDIHYVIFRQLTWDDEAKPVGMQRWYRISDSDLSIKNSFPFTRDSRQWLQLYEASADVTMPPDLATQRQLGHPASQVPTPAQPQAPEPAIQPRTGAD